MGRFFFYQVILTLFFENLPPLWLPHQRAANLKAWQEEKKSFAHDFFQLL